jgi:hypothetical protein
MPEIRFSKSRLERTVGNSLPPDHSTLVLDQLEIKWAVQVQFQQRGGTVPSIAKPTTTVHDAVPTIVRLKPRYAILISRFPVTSIALKMGLVWVTLAFSGIPLAVLRHLSTPSIAVV